MEVREVKRKAKVGEWVKIIDASNIPKTNGINDYNNGSIIQIIGIENDCWVRYGYGTDDNYIKRILADSEYVVLENYNQLDLSTITNEQLIAELTNRLGGK